MTQSRFLAKSGLDANGISIIGLADPTNATDAVTKQYSDNAANIGSGTLPVARLPALTGDISTTIGTVATTLATVTQSTGATFAKITLDTKGRVTGNTTVVQADITGLLGAGSVSNTMLANGAVANLSGTNTGDQVIPSASSTTPAALGVANVGTGTTFARADHVHLAPTTITGNAGTATVLETARTINGVSFNGSTNITINAVDSTERIASSLLGAASGVVPLDATSKILATYLPSYVDDVLEYANLAALPGTGETGKIYVALDTNKTYRWSGSAYIYITSGAVDSVAGRTGAITLTSTDVGLANASNTSDANKPVSTATATALLAAVPAQTGNSGKYLSTNGTASSWTAVDALPSQTGNSGKYLTTSGTAASWAVLNVDPNVTTKGLYEHSKTISANYAIGSGNNASSVGPLTIASGAVVTVPSDSRWMIL